MEKIIAVTFDIADQWVKMYNALEWHNFIADTREQCPNAPAGLEELFDYAYGDEFWFEVAPKAFDLYDVAFNLRTEEFVICRSDHDCEALVAWAEDIGDPEDIFWTK